METRQERAQMHEDTANWLAAATVRQKTTQHPCTGDDRTCTHRNHRRDADYRQNMMLTLGLTEAGDAS